MASHTIFAAAVLAAVLVVMLFELILSQRNERLFRQAGAVDAPDEVYAAMRLAYPGSFIAMAIEGALWAPAAARTTWLGVAIFLVAKALKAWAIASLGHHWTYRVLVRPGEPLVRRGPYVWIRHPNYVAVVGELVGMALIVGARVTGPVATLVFLWLLRRRIIDEERALGMRAEGA